MAASSSNVTTIHRVIYPRRKLPDDHPFDIILCFDTTGSMHGFLNAVKESTEELVTEICAKIKNVQIGVSKGICR